MTGIDLNRAGTPLLEIVSEPDMRSSREAVAYAKVLHSLVRWIGICDGNMQEGSFRCDANVSVRPRGSGVLGTRTEIKNLNSFRFLEKAIDFEVRRQIALIEDGGRVVQETRLWDPQKAETRPMRSKEDAHDYRYFPDPDLLPIEIGEDWIARERAAMPELPVAMRERFMREHGLPASDATTLTASKALAGYYEAVVRGVGGDPKACANWVLGELSALLNRLEVEADASPVSPEALAGLVRRLRDGTVSGKAAKDVFEAMAAGEGEADAIIDRRGLRQISDAGAIEALVDGVVAANPKLVEDYRAGREKAFNALIGQVMKASQGKANPAQASESLRRKLG
jgi:aspartyl-tRNA(Asn)/glutamyl-tRNA(Gln) amidotransferase subunit B